MQVMMDIQSELQGVLNSAEKGRFLAEHIAALLETSDQVSLDFANVQRMTPSFANAFVMVLLNRVSLDTVRDRLQMLRREPHVADAINRSANRFMRGFRLTIQYTDELPRRSDQSDPRS